MVATICFYIFIGIVGLFGLALTVVSIASLVRNLRRDSRVKKYINEEQPEKQYTKTKDKHHNQEKCEINNTRPLVITQTQDNNIANVVIGYLPYSQTVVQANAGNSAEKKHKPIKNKTNTSKIQRNNNYNTRHNKNIPKIKLKNKNIKSNYNSRFTQRTYRRNNFT